MKTLPAFADFDHPLVKSTAERLADSQGTIEGKVEQILLFVRNEIKFYFPLKGDFVKASETIETKQGQCNTKGTLFLALCKAIGIPARLHFSLISKEIQKGFFSGPSYWLMPKSISHSWIEVFVQERWNRVDSYINDRQLHAGATKELDRLGWQTGFSISKAESNLSSNNQFLFGTEQFEQMGAVTDDHGVWDEPCEYYASEMYRNRPGPIRMFIYRLVVNAANQRVAALRAQGEVG